MRDTTGGSSSSGSVAIVLQARMASTRLPGKALADLNGRPIVAHCIERLRAASGLKVVLATTERADDDGLAAMGAGLGVEVIRGPAEDVLARFALVVRTLKLSSLVRATADNPAVDLDAPRRTLEQLARTGADHVVESGLPYGAAVEAMAAEALLRAADLAVAEYDREHVTPFLHRDSRFRAVDVAAPEAVRRPGLRLTVDTQEDLDYMRRLVGKAEAACRPPVALEQLIAAAERL